MKPSAKPAPAIAVIPALYGSLLRLYPAAYRQQFADEMIAVFTEVDADARDAGTLASIEFCFREIAGLLRGALAEHTRRILGPQVPFPVLSRRFTMRSQFRFPKATAFLMTVILAGTIIAIEKARAVEGSLPPVNPQLPPIHPAHFTFFPTIAMIFAFFYAAGLVGWAVLHALHRSGVHRMSELADTQAAQK